MNARTGAVESVCGDEVGEEDLSAFMDKTWLTSGRRRSGKGERDE